MAFQKVSKGFLSRPRSYEMDMITVECTKLCDVLQAYLTSHSSGLSPGELHLVNNLSNASRLIGQWIKELDDFN